MRTNYSRREALGMIRQITVATALLPILSSFSNEVIFSKMLERPIPSSGELLPVVGLGTWRTFDTNPQAPTELKTLSEVLLKMKEKGGKLIDSSPMYGKSEFNVGKLTTDLGIKNHFFYATKVWTHGRQSGIDQMNDSQKKMSRETIDLVQIHNLIDWKTHVKTLKKWKEDGKIRYWGVTHYLNSSHSTLQKIIKLEKPDFVQFNYSIDNRNAELGLLQTAREYDVAVIINRPYSSGSLFKTTKGKKLPNWCLHHDINSWGQFFLKYVLSNEAVNCVIPGTSKPDHLVDNMMAGYGKIPNYVMQKEMLKTFKKL